VIAAVPLSLQFLTTSTLLLWIGEGTAEARVRRVERERSLTSILEIEKVG